MDYVVLRRGSFPLLKKMTLEVIESYLTGFCVYYDQEGRQTKEEELESNRPLRLYYIHQPEDIHLKCDVFGDIHLEFSALVKQLYKRSTTIHGISCILRTTSHVVVDNESNVIAQLDEFFEASLINLRRTREIIEMASAKLQCVFDRMDELGLNCMVVEDEFVPVFRYDGEFDNGPKCILKLSIYDKSEDFEGICIFKVGMEGNITVKVENCMEIDLSMFLIMDSVDFVTLFNDVPKMVDSTRKVIEDAIKQRQRT